MGIKFNMLHMKAHELELIRWKAVEIKDNIKTLNNEKHLPE